MLSYRKIVKAVFSSLGLWGLFMGGRSVLLKPLDAVYHFALRFITGDSFRTHLPSVSENWLACSFSKMRPTSVHIYL